jgi:anti-sigma factor RsiW
MPKNLQMTNESCGAARERLSDYLERALGPGEREAVGRHLEGCAECARRLDELKALAGALHELDRVALPEGFEDRLARRLAAEPAPARPSRAAAPAKAPARAPWRAWLGLTGWPVRGLAGAAVAVALFLAFEARGPHGVPLPGTGPAAVPVSAPAVLPHVGLGQEALVRIWFDAPRDVGNVRFTLDLPAGVRMVRDGKVVDSAQLTWEGELKAGRNVIPLHVRGVARGEWTVTAKVERDGAERASSIGLEVDGA